MARSKKKVEPVVVDKGASKQRVFRFYEGEYTAWMAEAQKRGTSLTKLVREAMNAFVK